MFIIKLNKIKIKYKWRNKANNRKPRWYQTNIEIDLYIHVCVVVIYIYIYIYHIKFKATKLWNMYVL